MLLRTIFGRARARATSEGRSQGGMPSTGSMPSGSALSFAARLEATRRFARGVRSRYREVRVCGEVPRVRACVITVDELVTESLCMSFSGHDFHAVEGQGLACSFCTARLLAPGSRDEGGPC